MAKGIRRTFTQSYLLCLTPEQKIRLDKAAHVVGKKIADLVRDVVMLRVEEIEEEVRLAKDRQDEDRARTFVPRSPGRPRGLGIDVKERLGEPRSASVRSTTPSYVTPSVPPISPEPSPADAQNDDIGRLAKYILEATNAKDREERSQRVTDEIRSNNNRVAAERLARALDLRIAMEKEKMPAPKNARSVWSLLGGRK